MLQTGAIGGPKLLQLIGRGTYGSVYKAAWRGSLVAAKVIPISQSDKTVVMKEIETVQYKYNVYAGAHSS